MYKSTETPKISGFTQEDSHFALALDRPFLLDLLKLVLIALFAFLSGLAFSFVFKTELEGYYDTASDFFAFFKQDGVFLYKLTSLCLRDIGFFILTSFSSLSFICMPLNSCVISVGGFFYGICVGILFFINTPHRNAAAYAVAVLSVMILLVISSAISRKYNRLFANAKSSKNEFPRLAKTHLVSECPVYVAYIALKALFCVWLCLK